MAAKNKKVELKCVMLGKAHVGKTCLVERFKNDRWAPDLGPTIGAAFVAKDVMVGKRAVTIGVWDTAGSERYAAMTRHYYQGAEAAVICYDVTDAASWAKVKHWVKEILDICEECILAIVATKMDLLDEGKTRAVDREEVAQYVRSINAGSYETSSRTGQSVMAPFQDICQKFTARPPRQSVSSYEPVTLAVTKPTEPPNCAC